MPKGNAAKFIARDIRKNKEKRRKKIKTKSNQHQNQHEFLRQSTRKRQPKKSHQFLLEGDLLGSDDQISELEHAVEENEVTVTHELYTNLMKDPNFLLTMQPRMFEAQDKEEDDEGAQDDQKLLSSAGVLGKSLQDSQIQPLTESESFHEVQKLDAISSVSIKKKVRKLHKEELELEDALRFRWYIIQKRGKFRSYWDYIVMTLAIYNCLWTPLTISFDWASQQDDTNTMLNVIEYCILAIYSADIVIQFLTSYYNVQTGDEITKPRLIAKKYLRGEFIIDFLSTFPFRYFGSSSGGYKVFASICQLLKVLRIRKMYSSISQANLKIETKALTKIAFFSFLLCVYTHIVGCILWFFLKTDYQWVAPTDFGNIRSRLQDPWYLASNPDSDSVKIADQRLDSDLFVFQWLSMWYHSALTLMLVEITPRSISQLFALIFVYIVNAIFNAILFGIYFDLLEEARRRQNEFQTQIDNANTAMVNLSLPAKIEEQVRNYILQTHETKTQQQEYVSFATSMPPSKNVGLNALNFKKALNKSPNMIQFRLTIRDEYRKRLRNLKPQDYDDPNRDVVDPDQGDKEFRKLMKTMVYNLTVQHVQPEEIIIMQSDHIKDSDGEWNDSKAYFYIILNGDFKVSSLRFNKRKKAAKVQNDSNPSSNFASGDFSQAEIEPLAKQSKKLVSGDYFGEVSFLYDCRRTSTIKAKLYATLGCINHTAMNEMLRDFPDFKSHMLQDVVNLYDDDLKLFLTATLRKIDYLANVSDEILVNLAYICNAEIKEKGSILYNMDDEYEEQITDELVIVFDGSVELYLTMDAGTEFSLEVLPTGSILNAHNMLARRKHSVNVRFGMNTTFYYLKYDRLVQVAKMYPEFAQELLKQIGKAEAMKSREQNPIDYIKGVQNYYDIQDRPLDQQTSARVFNIMFAFKNSIIYYLLKNRKDRKVKNLKKILEEFIQKKNKQKELQRIKKRQLEALPLDEKLERLIDDDKVLTEIQYENVRDIMDTIVKENIEQNFTQLRLLKSNFMDRLIKRGTGKSDLSEYKKIDF